MTSTTPPRHTPAEPPPRRGPVRRYLEVRGFVGGHTAPHAHVRLAAADGTGLTGTFLPGPTLDAPAVVLLHGFAAHGRKPSYARLADALSATCHVLALDLRGHGRSAGETTLGDREVLDAAAGVDWLRHHGPRWVALVGASMGGTTALHAAVDTGADAVVAISAPATFRDEPDTKPMQQLKALWENPVSRHGMRMLLGVRIVHPARWRTPPHPRDLAAGIDVPVLVVHGEDDAYFPASDAEELAAAAPISQLWLEPAGFGHAEDGFTPEFADRLGQALRTVATSGAFPPRSGASVGMTGPTSS